MLFTVKYSSPASANHFSDSFCLHNLFCILYTCAHGYGCNILWFNLRWVEAISTLILIYNIGKERQKMLVPRPPLSLPEMCKDFISKDAVPSSHFLHHHIFLSHLIYHVFILFLSSALFCLYFDREMKNSLVTTSACASYQ